jgi:MFS family permease
MKQSRWVLPVIVFSQFCCTSLWFAGNGVMPNLISTFHLTEQALGDLTSSVQVGFIAGTLLFAVLTIADRFSPSKVFFISAILGALFNLGIIWGGNSLISLIVLRFFTGLFLAGIYPVGMKIASDYYEKGLGKSLGFLVGALVLGTAFPHLLKDMTRTFPWKSVLIATSSLSVLGGVLMVALVPDGPHRKRSKRPDLSAFFSVFKNPAFRSASFGYFGHMWELYAFWTWCPVVWEAYLATQPSLSWDASVITFCVMAIGGLGCVLGGFASAWYGSAVVAFVSLAVSGLLCLLSPALYNAPPIVMLLAYLIWGLAVAADSPQFSSLVATTAPATNKGTALTIINCIGFAITIGSIQLLGVPLSEQYLFLLLAPGPVFGLWSMLRLRVFGASSVSQRRR